MKFDVVVGNPPYQENNDDNNRDSPIYQNFYDLAEKMSSKYCLISPARFLFNAGQTPKEWNERMLNNEHLKVVYFNQNSGDVFPGTDIKGGIAVLYHDFDKNFGAIETFTTFDELNTILNKVVDPAFESIAEILYLTTSYSLTEQVFKEHPHLASRVNNGDKALRTNIFDKLPEVFCDFKQSDSQVLIYGRQNNQRVYKYVDIKYIQDGGNLYGWKVFVPKANGSGAIGEVLSTPVIGQPVIGHTQTFISFGNFDNEYEAQSLFKYLKTKFSRTMLGIKKTTQDNTTKETWSKVPLQDFTANSDIDWTQSIADIDQQLYKKYGLDQTEINFIETKVKAMD